MAPPEAPGSSVFCGRSLKADSVSPFVLHRPLRAAGSTASGPPELGLRGRPPNWRQGSTEQQTRMELGWPGTEAQAATPGLVTGPCHCGEGTAKFGIGKAHQAPVMEPLVLLSSHGLPPPRCLGKGLQERGVMHEQSASGWPLCPQDAFQEEYYRTGTFPETAMVPPRRPWTLVNWLFWASLLLYPFFRFLINMISSGSSLTLASFVLVFFVGA